ncbi:hypothetical protein D3C77_466850 [compost metagenome]
MCLKDLLDDYSPELRQVDFFSRCLAVAVSIPNNSNDSVAYREGVIQPCDELRALQASQSKDQSPSMELVKKSFLLLQKIMITKGVSSDEQKRWLKQIAKDSNIDMEKINIREHSHV